MTHQPDKLNMRSISLAVLITLVLLLPQVIVYVAGSHPLVIANESLSYRFFYSFRAAALEPNAIFFLPQGQLIDALGVLFHKSFGAGFDLALPGHLKAATAVFAFYLFVLNGLVLAASLELCLRCRLQPIGATVLTVGVVVLGYYSSSSGVSFLITPDYYLFEVSLTALCLAIAISIGMAQSVRLERTLVALGMVAALLVTIKMSLVGALAFPIAALWWRVGRRALLQPTNLLLFTVVAFSVALAVVLTAFAFDLTHIRAVWRPLLAYLSNPGGEENFWTSLFRPWSEGANAGASYQYAFVVVAVVAIALGWAICRMWHSDCRALWILIGIPGLIAFAHGWSVGHRPAGTTLWELSVYFLAFAAWCVAATSILAQPVRLPARRLAVSLALVTVAVCVWPVSRIIDLPRFRAASTAVWDAHTHFARFAGEKIVFIPDNNYTTGSVEEGLMKGFSDIPTWSITSGQLTLSRIFPGLTITNSPPAAANGVSLLWIDIGGTGSLSARVPYLGVRKSSGQCTSYHVETWPWRPRNIVVCGPMQAKGSTDAG